MNKKIIAAAVASVLTLPMVSAQAVEVVGKKLEIYGKFHLSVDVSNTDGLVSTDGLSISSNSSRLGFKGAIPAGDMDIIYQLESELFMDEAGGKLTNRNTYAGLKGSFGKFFVGNYDTPFKTVASKWGVFGDGVGERRAILGAGYQSGNQLNERAQNALVYEMKTKTSNVQVMYAVDPESGADGAVDNSQKNVTSMSFRYNKDGLWFGAAYEAWKGHSKIVDGNALRVGAKYKMGKAQIGLIYENINSSTVNEWQRSAYGANLKYKISKATDFRAQYLVAGSAKNTTDTGASKLGLGIHHKLNKKSSVYVEYAVTNNQANAKFQAVDGGHGDEVKTVNGGSPSSISFGMVYKF